MTNHLARKRNQSVEDISRDLMEKLRAGTLTKEEFEALGFDRTPYGILDNYQAFTDATLVRWKCREKITKECSWFIFTARWLSELQRLVEGKRVVEVCAGTGVLGPLMEARGIEWICTDIEPGGDHVRQLDAFDRLELLSLQPDVLFAAWIPYGSILDCALAQTRCPLILVGESPGGCTGSEDLYEHEAWETAISPSDLYPAFEDVPQWDGIHDHTMLINWPERP